MNKTVSIFTLTGFSLIAGFSIQALAAQSQTDVELSRIVVAAAEQEILYWVAPMDANFRRDKPGKSPMGMDLVPVYKTPEILYWVAPMDANFRRDKPGKSPMGMDLVPVYKQP